MVGDLADFVRRLRAVLPSKWFSNDTPVLTTVLECIGTPWVNIYDLIKYSTTQTRLATVNGFWLDMAARDYLGDQMLRQPGETDNSFRPRFISALLAESATRPAISSAIASLTGTAPMIFEPAKSQDTGGYGGAASTAASAGSGLAYGMAGGWGSIQRPYQFFVTVTRPVSGAGGLLAGYGTGQGGYCIGHAAYFDFSEAPGRVTDEQIENAIARRLPTNGTAWLRII